MLLLTVIFFFFPRPFIHPLSDPNCHTSLCKVPCLIKSHLNKIGTYDTGTGIALTNLRKSICDPLELGLPLPELAPEVEEFVGSKADVRNNWPSLKVDVASHHFHLPLQHFSQSTEK